MLGRYQGFSDSHSFGVLFGVKLPTGETKQTFNLSPRFQVYAFAQVPVAQRVTGLQIEPKWSASLGLHWTF